MGKGAFFSRGGEMGEALYSGEWAVPLMPGGTRKKIALGNARVKRGGGGFYILIPKKYH